MNISLLKRGGLSKLSLLAIPLVSLLGVTNVNAAVSDAVALPAVQDNKIVLEAGKEYKGAGFVIPAGTTIEGNDATVYGRVAVAATTLQSIMSILRTLMAATVEQSSMGPAQH